METEPERWDTVPVDQRLESSFRPGSVKDGIIEFERIKGIGSEVKVQVYMDSPQPLLVLGDAYVKFSYSPCNTPQELDR